MKRLLRYAQIACLLVALLVLGSTAYAVSHYVHTASLFEVTKLSVSGLKRVQENEVLAETGFDIGSNIFSVDLAEVRKRVEGLRWVRQAVVQRVLPDQIVIKVVEREPIGVGRLRGEVYQFDTDGVILPVDPAAISSFPVLDGLRFGDAVRNAKKVDAYKRVVEELGQSSLSEIHINDAGEVAVVSSSEPLLVNLGATDFRTRWMKYLQLKTQIQHQYPEAVSVDLRFKNQVIVNMRDEADSGEKIVWGAEKNTL